MNFKFHIRMDICSGVREALVSFSFYDQQMTVKQELLACYCPSIFFEACEVYLRNLCACCEAYALYLTSVFDESDLVRVRFFFD